MPTLPEDLYDCFAASLFCGRTPLRAEISHLVHGRTLYSLETRRQARRDNALDIIRARQTCKAMHAAVKALEQRQFRTALDQFWTSAFAGPTEFFCCPVSRSTVFTGPWSREYHSQSLCYEGREVLKLHVKRRPQTLEALLVTRLGDELNLETVFPKIKWRVNSDDTDSDSEDEDDAFTGAPEVSLRQSELAQVLPSWLAEQRAAVERELSSKKHSNTQTTQTTQSTETTEINSNPTE